MSSSSLLRKKKTTTKKKKKNEGEAIMICLDNSDWMESTDSPMFQEQVAAIKLYCDNKFKSNLDTVVGVCGMADSALGCLLQPTRCIQGILAAINGAPIGGCLRILEAASDAHFYWFGSRDTVMQKRIVFFAGGRLFSSKHVGTELAQFMLETNLVCDAISFGDPYLAKRNLFDNLVNIPPKYNAKCNVCHVPPESSVLEALSRSQMIIPHVVGGPSCSPPPSPSQELPIQICVKAPPTADAYTDCPFCQRVLSILLEKKLLYKTQTHTINLNNKPDWFVAANPDGILPLIKFDDDDEWYSNSDVIVEMIEKKYPATPLVAPRYFSYLGLKILPKLLAHLKNESDGTYQALLLELSELEEHLSEHGGPYVNGKNITAVDLSLAPKLYHLEEACKHFKQWTIPEEYTKVLDYKKMLFVHPSFDKTKPLQKDIIAGWTEKLMIERRRPNY